MIVARTTFGKGVSFMERRIEWHYLPMSDDEYGTARSELRRARHEARARPDTGRAGWDDERIVLLTGDLGFAALEPFAERFPDRFFNAGVAEQNMVGVATGLAEAGFMPYVYSIATFASMRPYEFIRNGPDPAPPAGARRRHRRGLDYGHNGMTHYALEDVALMRVQPGMTIVVLADRGQTAPRCAPCRRSPDPSISGSASSRGTVPASTAASSSAGSSR